MDEQIRGREWDGSATTVLLTSLGAATVLVAHSSSKAVALAAVVVGTILAAWLGRSLLLGLIFAAVLSLGVPEASYAPYLLAIPSVIWRGRASTQSRPVYFSSAWSAVVSGILIVLAVLITTLRAAQGNDFLLMQIALLACVAVNVASARRFSALTASLPKVAALLVGISIVYTVESSKAAGSGGPNAWAASGFLSGWINRNALAVVFSVVALFYLDRVLRSRRRLTSSLMGVAAAVATALTFSRSGYVALVVGAIVCMYRGRKKLLLLAPFAALGTQYLSGPVLQRIEYTSSNGTLDASSSLRLELWKVAWNLTLGHPIIGVGIQSLGDEFRIRDLGDDLVFAHNTYLTVLAAYGLIIPSAVVLLVLTKSFGRQRQRRDDGKLSVICCVAIASFFGEPLFTSAALAALLPFLAAHWANGEIESRGENEDPAGQRHSRRRVVVSVASSGTSATRSHGRRDYERRGTSDRPIARRGVRGRSRSVSGLPSARAPQGDALLF